MRDLVASEIYMRPPGRHVVRPGRTRPTIAGRQQAVEVPSDHDYIPMNRQPDCIWFGKNRRASRRTDLWGAPIHPGRQKPTNPRSWEWPFLEVCLSSQPARTSVRGLNVEVPLVAAQHGDIRAGLHVFHHGRHGARRTE